MILKIKVKDNQVPSFYDLALSQFITQNHKYLIFTFDPKDLD